VKHITRLWGCTAAVANLEQAQADLHRWVAVSDRRKRRSGTIARLACPRAVARLASCRVPSGAGGSARGLSHGVAFEGNRCSVPPGMVGQTVTVRSRLGNLQLEIVSPANRRLARHRRAAASAGQVLQSDEHARQLTAPVLDAFTTAGPCRATQHRPPGEGALRAAAAVRGEQPTAACHRPQALRPARAGRTISEKPSHNWS
jgi:hypothetical protein